MRSDLDAAVERARLTAEDLASAAGEVIRWGALKPEVAEDDVDFAMLSRRWTSYLSPQRPEDESNDIAFAASARSEADGIVASRAASPGGGGAASDDGRLADRFQAIAVECEHGRAQVVMRAPADD